MQPNIQEITKEVEKYGQLTAAISAEVKKVIVGQDYLIERLLIGLLANGHILVEGVPGLAKTTAVKTLARTVDTSFQRIQFTPDLLPADLIGTQIYEPKTGNFNIKKGPLFSNIILADEINRAPAKVQSALLEAMQERQVTIGETTFPLQDPFLVMATQNPIEQEGTYPLPEAQVDRFMLKLRINYPNKAEEKEIIKRVSDRAVKPSTKWQTQSRSARPARWWAESTWMKSFWIISWRSSLPPGSQRCSALISSRSFSTEPRRGHRSILLRRQKPMLSCRAAGM